MNLIGFEPPFGIQGKPDIGQPEELLVSLGLREEVGAAGLEIENHVDPVGPGDLDPGPQDFEAHLLRSSRCRRRRSADATVAMISKLGRTGTPSASYP